MNTWAALALSVFTGWFVAGAAMLLMRTTVKYKNQSFKNHLKESFSLISCYVGGTERAIATTLIIAAPKMLVGFIGGWMLLKIAANWGRQKAPEHDEEKDKEIRTGHLLALVGAAISFGFAIWMGLLANPDALAVLRD